MGIFKRRQQRFQLAELDWALVAELSNGAVEKAQGDFCRQIGKAARFHGDSWRRCYFDRKIAAGAIDRRLDRRFGAPHPPRQHSEPPRIEPLLRELRHQEA